GRRMEHSLEVQLPFLQLVLPELKIVPIVIQDYSVKNCQRVAEAITGAIGNKNVLLLASSDLYHGYSYQECQATDARTLAKIEELEPEKFLQGCADGTYSACGAGPIAVVQMVAKNLGANKARVIHQTNSNDVTGQKGGYVVGYGAVVIYKEGKKMEPKERKVGVDMGLSDDEKKQLLEIARTTIEHRVRGQEVPPVKVTSEILREKRGAFVTINKHGNLRGCIGYVLPYQPLYITIQEMAEAAALRDPRFPPVTPDELDDLEIEISVLTPVREIKDINEIEVGKHGIIIEKGGYSGLLLPQVATEYGWDRITFLEHTCNKAGLPKNAWKEKGTVIKIFSADVFGEK
ncbi:MAG: AmmeMemoRadiSam system protein A, partial [candidate division KSB1 bacterium]|nr:AmmeMemoRadiSam system protein A [candidate division KSB1 bacterium]